MQRLIILSCVFALNFSNTFLAQGSTNNSSPSRRFGWGFFYSSESGEVSLIPVYGLILFFVLVFVLALLIIRGYKLVIKSKAKKAEKLLQSSELKDPVWNLDAINETVKNSFLLFQNAWMKQDMTLMNGKMSEKLKAIYQQKLNRQIDSKVYNLMSDIKINEIKMVGFSDVLDDSLDGFSVYIAGTMVDVLVRVNGNALKNEPISRFEDIYTFQRSGDNWVIVGISNNFNVWNISAIQTIQE